MVRKRKRKKRKAPVHEDGMLPFPCSWGGARPRAGRKASKDSGVSHATREEFRPDQPVHVTMKLRAGLPSLRRKRTYRVVANAIVDGSRRFGIRLVHYTVQSNHLHLVVEAPDRHALTRAMQGLGIRIAKGLNKLWQRTGGVFAHRFHTVIVRCKQQMRNVLRYVLMNCKNHGIFLADPDPYSSARWFDGWRDYEQERGNPLPAPQAWLVHSGWKEDLPLLALKGP